MSIKEIITVPDDILKKISEPIEKVGINEKKLINDLFETMYHSKGIGLAAVQVGVLKRVLVVDISNKDKKNQPIALINPVIKNLSEEKSVYEEGCLSLPGHFAEIERPSECHLNYIDYEGKKNKLKAKGLLATCIQHEIDHLNGVLFIDYLSKIKKDMIIKKLIKYKKEVSKIIL